MRPFTFEQPGRAKEAAQLAKKSHGTVVGPDERECPLRGRHDDARLDEA